MAASLKLVESDGTHALGAWEWRVCAMRVSAHTPACAVNVTLGYSGGHDDFVQIPSLINTASHAAQAGTVVGNMTLTATAVAPLQLGVLHPAPNR